MVDSARFEQISWMSSSQRVAKRVLAVVITTMILPLSTRAEVEDGLYRPGAEPVLSPPKANSQDDSRKIIDAFVRAYANKKSPRVVLFWNRSLSDQLNDVKTSEKVTQIYSSGDITADLRIPDIGERSVDASSRRFVSKTERTDQTIEEKGKRRDTSERYGWALEDAVVRTLTGMGTKLVDRSAAMRFLAAERDLAPSALDGVRIETDALLKKGDLLLEILLSEDASTPSGLIYRILVKEIGSGRLLASGFTDARPAAKAPERTFRAGERGFEKISAPDLSISEVATELGNHVAKTLTMALSR